MYRQFTVAVLLSVVGLASACNEKGAQEAQLARAAAERQQAKQELAQLQAVDAQKAAQEQQVQLARDSLAKVVVNPVATTCTCAPGAKAIVRCHLRSDATVAVKATVTGSANVNFDTGLLGPNGDRTAAGKQAVVIQPSTEQDIEVPASIGKPPGNACRSTSNCACAVSSVKLL